MHTTGRLRMFAVALGVAGALCIASTTGTAKLVIDSPKDGETVQLTPGLGPVAVIKSHPENFKIESLAGHDAMHHEGAMAGMGEMQGTSTSQWMTILGIGFIRIPIRLS